MREPFVGEALGNDLRAGSGSRRKKYSYLTGMFIDTIGSGMWTPIALIYFANAGGLPLNQVGVALTIGGIVGLLTGPLGGGLVDKWGPERFALLSNVVRMAIFLCYPFVDAAWQIAVLSAFFAAADRLFWTSNAPLLATMATGREMDSLLSTQSVIRVVGIGIGAAVSGALAGSAQGLHVLVIGNAASYLLASFAFVVAFGLSGRDRRYSAAEVDAGDAPAGSWQATLADRPYVLLCLVQTMFAFASSSLVVILPVVAINTLEGAAWLAGGSVVVGNVVLVLVQKPITKLSGRWPRVVGLTVASCLFALAFAVMLPGPALTPAGVVVIVMASSVLGVIAEAFFIPSMTAAANESAPAALRGRYSAMFQLSWGLSGVLSPALFTWLLTGGNAVLWTSLTALMVVSIPILLLTSRKLPAGVLRA